MQRLSTVLSGILLTALVAASAAADGQPGPGVTDTEIRIGNTSPYSGPASAYGTIGKAIAAYFAKVNDEGGINGRKIAFISYDDGYSPSKTVEMTRKLVERDEVLAVFGNLGTPTNSAIHRYMNARKVPQLFLATGATKWGDPQNHPWTMAWQPNYQSEGRIYARYILRNHPDGRIGILFQNDDYGKDYVKGLRDGLGDAADTMIVAALSYETSDPTVDSQIVSLKASGADIFYNVTTPKFAAQAIRKSAEIGWHPVHFLNSVSNSPGAVLKPAGFENAEGILSSFYHKDPTDPQWQDDPAFREWSAWMDKYYPAGDKTSTFNVYGYLVSQTMEQVLRQCGDGLTRENVMKQAASLRNLRFGMLLPGVTVDTGPDDYFAIEQMRMARFDGEQWELFGEVLSGEIGS